MSQFVSLKNVGKTYANKVIFSNITLSVEQGKPVVIMGRNGCGKSTLLKIITGVLSHTEGEIIRAPKIKTSFVPDRFPKLPFSVREYILHMGRIQGISDSDVNRYMDFQFEYLDIPQNIKDQKIYKCSKGTIQKINIMQAFLLKSDLLVMDEPFSGLDEGSIERLIELLTKTSEDGVAMVLSCHEKVLAQRVTDNIFAFSGQSLVKNQDNSNHLRIKFVANTSNINNGIFDFLDDKVIFINTIDELYEILVDKDRLKEVLFLLFENGYEIYSINPVS